MLGNYGRSLLSSTFILVFDCSTINSTSESLSNLSRNLSRNVGKKDFRTALQGMLHQSMCSVQLAMIIIKNSIKTASANVWCQTDSQKPMGSHSVYKQCETSYKRDVRLCNALKMRYSVAAIVAKSRT